MRRLKFLMPVWFLLTLSLFSALVMLLWNWLMPMLFGLVTINFWHAAGLLVLARILFGGFGLHKGGMLKHAMHHHHGNTIHEKWMNMTPEERNAFIMKRRKFGFMHPFGGEHFDMGEHQEQKKENE